MFVFVAVLALACGPSVALASSLGAPGGVACVNPLSDQGIQLGHNGNNVRYWLFEGTNIVSQGDIVSVLSLSNGDVVYAVVSDAGSPGVVTLHTDGSCSGWVDVLGSFAFPWGWDVT